MTQNTQQPLWIRIGGQPESWTRALTLGVAAAALTLTGSFLNFLNYNEYPVISSEVSLVLAGILAASIVLGISAAALGAFGRIIIPALLVVLAIDVNFDSTLALLLGLAAAIVFARFSRQALILLFGIVVISQSWTATLAGGSGRPDMADKTAPVAYSVAAKPELALVHLILDEHIGLDGIPDSVPRGPEMREQLRKFYVGSGFRVFAGAYSESLHTINAIPRALSLDAGGAWEKRGRSGTTLDSNPYFDMLQSMGFSIDVAQSDWINYCAHPAVVACATRAAGRLISVGDKLPVPDKAAILVYRFAALSTFARNGLNVYDLLAWTGRRFGYDLPLVQLLKRTNTSTLNGMATLEEVIGAARSLSPGKAIFAHVLLPHFPYVYDSACGTRRVSDWLGRASLAPRHTRYAAYFEQVTCATRKVEELLAAVASSPAAGKTVFIIHGDHGSRIMHTEPTVENDGRFSSRDLVDGHATFFVVSAPGIEPGYDTARYPLRLLLDALARSEFRAVAPDLPDGFVPTIAIEDRSWNPVTERSVGDLDWWQGKSEGVTDQ
jgi:hypothetical protein